MTLELEPCPRCGATVRGDELMFVKSGVWCYRVRCLRCRLDGFSGMEYVGPYWEELACESAAARWNDRDDRRLLLGLPLVNRDAT